MMSRTDNVYATFPTCRDPFAYRSRQPPPRPSTCVSCNLAPPFDLAPRLPNVPPTPLHPPTCIVGHSIRGQMFGLGTTEIGLNYRLRNHLPVPTVPSLPPGAKQTPHVHFVDPEFMNVLENKAHPLHAAAQEFYLHLALNHEVSSVSAGVPAAAPERLSTGRKSVYLFPAAVASNRPPEG